MASTWPLLAGLMSVAARPSLDTPVPRIDGVDPVVVALGVAEALEHDDAGALADEDAVGAPVERADRPGGARAP